MSLLKLDEIADVYIDALVTDEQRDLLFLSAWGHDTALQELQAKLTLPVREGGLHALSLYQPEEKHYFDVYLRNRQTLMKKTGRIHADCLLGHLAHIWIYESCIEQPDKTNQHGILLYKPELSKEMLQARLWDRVRTLCKIPLLTEWNKLLGDFTEAGWIRYLEGFGIHAVAIQLPADDINQHVRHCVQQGYLTLPKQCHLKLVL